MPPSDNPTAPATPTALVTGGNRGIGFQACRGLARAGLRVILAARDPELGSEAAETLTREKLDVRPETLDVTDAGTILACRDRLEEAGEHIDVLVNNAGVFPGEKLLDDGTEPFETAVAVNLMGPYNCAHVFAPAMVVRGWGRIVNVSSGYGSFSEGLQGPPAYCVTKAALNALTIKLAHELPETVKVNAMDPGWVRTRMGGPNASSSPEEAADTLVWLVQQPDDGPTGGFFRHRRQVAW